MPTEWARGYLPADSVVAEKIAAIYPGLSAALKQFADFVLAEPMKVAKMSINETVHASGVSVATANRFARKLGFEGYAQFRTEVIEAFEPMFAPVERLRTAISKDSPAAEIVASSLEEDIENLRASMLNLDAARLEQAVEMIVKADRIYMLAFDNAGALANVFAHRMEMAGKRIRMVDNAGGTLTAARHLSSFTERDLVFAIAFPRYMRDTVDLARAAHKKGLPMLALTDTQASPLASLGSLTLYVHSRRTIGSTSDAAILAILEALAAAVSAKLPGATDAAQHFADFAYPWFISPGGRG
ncbi:MurR/RpiR family transcriptional regulator [Pelagibacterium xiamenense]|uniref:MurR/RpiR family transcriptional regulator n=1 Tax=Pelagibacterium xiamenense TaxID=2901140 RepID=UPI001E330140|nr:MurR/RpiR family transcriptional regulator [Pelagibacterium xiamenense]MCD7060719.1 MurR/RpiR family transcriptional regulator [Pelagibacterium xiamenense]